MRTLIDSPTCRQRGTNGTRRHLAAHRPPRVTGAATIVRRPAPTCLQAFDGPRVLHIDRSERSAQVLDTLLVPAARVTHVQTVAAARELLRRDCFSLVVLDPDLDDGDAEELLPLLLGTPLLVYSTLYPVWGEQVTAFLPKPVTPINQLWGVMTRMLGIDTRQAAHLVS
jgi:two-component system phosphate regulon response regulator OmpR